MTSLLNRFFTFLLLIGAFMPMSLTHAVWEQPPHQFPENGTSFRLSSDANGNAIVIDSDSIGGISFDINAWFYSRVSNMWLGPTFLGVGSGAIALDMDPSGTALALWVDVNGSDIHSNFFDGITWTPGSPDPFATNFVQALRVSMNGPDSALAVWYDGTIRSAFFSGGTWGPTITVGSGTIPITADYSSNGTAVVSYLDGTILRVSNFNGTSWGPGIPLDLAVSLTANNAVCQIDANGHAAVVWVNTAGDTRASTYNGVAWLPSVLLSTTPGNFPFSVSFDMAPSGTGVAIWVDGAKVGFSSSYNGSTWSTPQIFASPISPFQTSVSVNASGDALLLFQTPDITFEDGDILSARLPLNGVWTTPVFVRSPGDEVPILISSLSDNGFGFAGWAEGVEGLDYFATVEVAPLPPEPPASVVGSFCKNKFAMQTDCIHTITWTASPTSTVVAYEIRRNGVVIAIVPATDRTFIDGGRCRQTDVYTVAAIDINGLISPPVVVVIP